MSLATVRRGGRVMRICDPDWADPLDPSFSMLRGGRWNEPGSFPVLYVNADAGTARANVVRRFRGMPYGPEDLAIGPELAVIDLARGSYVDCETEAGLRACALPPTYPLDPDGREIGWPRCQPIGRSAFNDGLAGVACRSAASPAAGLRELAHIVRSSGSRPELLSRIPFSDWFWAVPAPRAD